MSYDEFDYDYKYDNDDYEPNDDFKLININFNNSLDNLPAFINQHSCLYTPLTDTGSTPTKPTEEANLKMIYELKRVDYQANKFITGTFSPFLPSIPLLPPSYLNGLQRGVTHYAIHQPLVNQMFDR